MLRKKLPNPALLKVWAKLSHIFIVVAMFSMFINALMLVPSIYMLQIYDRVLASRNLTTLWMLTIIVLGVYASSSAIEWIRSRILIRAGAKLEEEINQKVFTSAFQSVLKKIGTDPRQAISDLTNVRQFLTGNGLQIFFDAPWAPIYLAFSFFLHPILGWFTLGGMVVLLSLTIIMEWATHKPLGAANAMAIQSSKFANNQLANAEVIEAMGMLEALRLRWQTKHNQMLSLQAKASDRAGMISSVTKFVRISMQSLVLGVGAYLVIVDGLSPGAMMVASILMGRALAPIEQVIGTWRNFSSTRSAYHRLKELLNYFPDQPQAMPLQKPAGDVSVENLIATPPNSQDIILKGVNFSFAKGEVVAVIGHSGSGKSTLARLLVGIWAPNKGVVRLDGMDVYLWDKSELGPWMGYLPQDIELFDGTIAENIARFGKLDSEKIIEAANRADIHDLILHLPKGYDTEIGPGGSSLSGGQRQRIALARALYGNPSLIVLDEPNSNLDEKGEAALTQAIINLKNEGKSVVLISHRPNIIGIADKLLILHQGTVQAYGPRDQIIQSLQEARQASIKAVPKAQAAS